MHTDHAPRRYVYDGDWRSRLHHSRYHRFRWWLGQRSVRSAIKIIVIYGALGVLTALLLLGYL
jgi:hypothetical protein